MPYLSPERKNDLRDAAEPASTAGDLSYLFAGICNRYIEDNGLSFKTYADIVAALETLKLEVSRRFQWYEEQKKNSNGDVLRAFNLL